MSAYTYYEFFAGGGMARAGLGPAWRCLFANDFDPKKAAVYARNWGADVLRPGDIAAVTPADLPGRAQLAWASFPCQDLSLAGMGAGLNGARSGTFWQFNRLMQGLGDRRPGLIVLENVCGALTSHEGADFAAICRALRLMDYTFGALVLDAAHFVPQSRPRLFIVATATPPPDKFVGEPHAPWHSAALRQAFEKLEPAEKESWVWWRLPAAPVRIQTLADVLEKDVAHWHAPAETQTLRDMMSAANSAKIRTAQEAGRQVVGALYKRARTDDSGKRVQRAEVRFDDLAGCLRTPAGGSSRQIIVQVEGPEVRTRLLTAREAARLMGLPDAYHLPEKYNDAYHVTGDGLVVPVVRFLTEHLLEPLVKASRARKKKAVA